MLTNLKKLGMGLGQLLTITEKGADIFVNIP